MNEATGDAVVLLDGDLQDPPELIEEFAEKWLCGYDVVYGISKKFEHSVVRNILSRIIKYLIKIFMGFDQAQNINSFRIFKQKLMSECKATGEIIARFSRRNGRPPGTENRCSR